MAVERIGRPEAVRLTRGERALALAGGLVFAVIFLAGTLLWLGFGESVYVARIMGALQSCF